MNRISSFIRMDVDERLDREFFVAHSSMKRFGTPQIIVMILIFVVFFFFGQATFGQSGNDEIALLLPILATGLLAFIFGFRKLKIRYGYAAVTDRRLIYYEYCDDETVNYHLVKTIYLSEVTAGQFEVKRSIFSKSFSMLAYTEFKALVVGADSSEKRKRLVNALSPLEPGPEALEFIQYVAGKIAIPKNQADSGRRMTTV